MTQSRTTTKDRQFVTALARGIQILQCFKDSSPALNCSQLARMTGIPQPTVWRLCHTLLECGMLTTVPGEKLRPSLAVLGLGYSAIAGLNLVELARPYMQEIASKFGAACALGMRHDKNMVFVERCEGFNELLLNLRVGSMVPLISSALGWAYIAGHPPALRKQIQEELRREMPARMAEIEGPLNKALADYDRSGFILNDGTFHKAYRTIAIPIVAPDGSVPYALNCGSASLSVSVSVYKKEVAPELLALAGMLKDALKIQR